MRDLGPSLRRLRLDRGMKQGHVAELLAVTQPTVSRWERGSLRPSAAQLRTLLRLLGAPAAPLRDAALRRLVEASMRPVHLICDATHRLLAASPARQARWRLPAHELCGRSLWRYATEEIAGAEARLAALGWYDGAVPAVGLRTGANADPVVPIAPGMVLWERLRLEDGGAARLVTTLAAGERLPPHAVAV
jgi:transcriptional regulator with XRE-family HTH domain